MNESVWLLMKMAKVSSENLALILIDLQKAFVYGQWKNFFGSQEVAPIKTGFDNCVSLLKELSPKVPVLFTQVPFPRPADFAFYNGLESIHNERKYSTLIKPSTNIMKAVGIEQWLEIINRKKISTVIIGGCVTTSCVRVSSIQLSSYCKKISYPIHFIVDLHLCAARAHNYIPRCPTCMDRYLRAPYYITSLCGQCELSKSPLESPVSRAVLDMVENGVTVVNQYDWGPVLKK